MAPRAMSGFAPEFVAAFQWPVLKRKTSPAAAGGDSRSGAGDAEHAGSRRGAGD